MNKIRFILAGLFALGLFTSLYTAGFAQQQAPPGRPGMGGMDPARMIDRRISNLTRELNLTTDQQTKIRAILEESVKSIRTARVDTTLSRRDRLVASRDMQKRQDEIDAKIKKVLTAEQVKKYEALPSGRGQFGGGMNIDTRLDFLDKQLNLTAEQKKKIRPILEKNAENMRSIFANRKEGEERSVLFEAMRKERDRASKEIEAVLTPEQAKKYRAVQEEQRQRMNNRQGDNAPR
jgi:Spy/CpxP family protein refolding chaperone